MYLVIFHGSNMATQHDDLAKAIDDVIDTAVYQRMNPTAIDVAPALAIYNKFTGAIVWIDPKATNEQLHDVAVKAWGFPGDKRGLPTTRRPEDGDPIILPRTPLAVSYTTTITGLSTDGLTANDPAERTAES